MRTISSLSPPTMRRGFGAMVVRLRFAISQSRLSNSRSRLRYAMDFPSIEFDLLAERWGCALPSNVY